MKTKIFLNARRLMLAGLAMLTIGVAQGWATDLAVNDVLIIENFIGGGTSTQWNQISSTYSSTYSSITMAVSGDASGLTVSGGNAKVCNPDQVPANMNGSHVWLNKSTSGYIEIDNIPLHNVTKFQAHWAQNNTPAVTFYYKFNGDASWTDGGNGGTSAAADVTSNEITVSSGKTSVSIKFQRSNSSDKNQRIDKVRLVVTQIEAACTNNVTIQKGAETNGTFTLTPNGSQASCDGVSVTVAASPNTNYYVSSVTESGASASPTISGSGNSWTVAYAANTTGTSTISVTFALKTLYTVRWYNEGVEITGLASGLTSVYSGDKVTGVPSDQLSSCSGEFIGWVKSDAAVADKSVTDAYTTDPSASIFTNQAGSPPITGNTEFHAVYRMRKPD